MVSPVSWAPVASSMEAEAEELASRRADTAHAPATVCRKRIAGPLRSRDMASEEAGRHILDSAGKVSGPSVNERPVELEVELLDARANMPGCLYPRGFEDRLGPARTACTYFRCDSY